MKATGVMIGNYLKNEGVIVKIDARSIFDMFNDNQKYEPIPLTKYWLTKLGFDRKGSSFWYKGYDYTIDTSGGIFIVHSDYVSVAYGIEVKYVHQLQNLFFALTGEELTIKNK